MFNIYILYSISAKKYYVGSTDNVERRLVEHNVLSHNTYTSKYRPWVLKAKVEISNDRASAMKVEKYIKMQKRKSFIETIIQKQSDEDFIKWLKYKSLNRDENSVG